MVPPQVGHRPGRTGAVEDSVERPHEKQYSRKTRRAARRSAARTSASGSSWTSRWLIRVRRTRGAAASSSGSTAIPGIAQFLLVAIGRCLYGVVLHLPSEPYKLCRTRE